jgi:hypothetical protein
VKLETAGKILRRNAMKAKKQDKKKANTRKIENAKEKGMKAE